MLFCSCLFHLLLLSYLHSKTGRSLGAMALPEACFCSAQALYRQSCLISSDPELAIFGDPQVPRTTLASYQLTTMSGVSQDHPEVWEVARMTPSTQESILLNNDTFMTASPKRPTQGQVWEGSKTGRVLFPAWKCGGHHRVVPVMTTGEAHLIRHSYHLGT